MKQQSELVGVQYLRGLAALSVVIAHTSGMADFDKYFGQEIFGGFLDNGARGVDLFFLISGFIICMISLRGPELLPSATGIFFAERRFTRIVPLMWFAILSYAVLRLLGRGTFFAGPYLRALILFPAWDVQPLQIWTLRHEAIFYIIFAISFLVWPRKAWILVGWATLPFVYAALSLPIYPTDFVGQVLRIFTHPVNVEFFTGFLIGVLWHQKTKRLELSVKVPPFILCTLCMIGLMTISYALSLKFDYLSSTIISSITCAPILFLGIHVKISDGILNRTGRLLGDASYSIYLFHPHFVSAVLGVWALFAHRTPIAIVIIGTILITTASCVLVHLFIERPLLITSRRLVERLAVSYA